MKANIQDIYGLAPSQHGMLLESTNGLVKGDMFIDQSVLLVRGQLDALRFLAAVEQNAATHSSLRSCFAMEAETPLQVGLDNIRPDLFPRHYTACLGRRGAHPMSLRRRGGTNRCFAALRTVFRPATFVHSSQ